MAHLAIRKYSQLSLHLHAKSHSTTLLLYHFTFWWWLFRQCFCIFGMEIHGSPEYVNIIVNRFNHVNSDIIRLIKREASYFWFWKIMLDPYKFNLRAIVDHRHRRFARNCGHYSASSKCCEKNTFHCNDTNINAILMASITLLHIYNCTN